MPPQSLTRRELYELVWSTPAYKAAQRFGVSGVALAKACAKAEVPLPPRGYWARIANGRRLKRPPLPKVPSGRDKPVVFGMRARPTKPEPAPLPAEVRDEVEDVLSARPLRVRKNVAEPHALLRWMREGRLDRTKRRRLAILDALLREFERRGYRVEGQYNELAVLDGTERIPFSLSERVRQRREADPNTRSGWTQVREDTGELRFRFQPRYGLDDEMEWRDAPGRPLEERLNEVLAGLVVATARLREIRGKEQERQAREWEAQRLRWIQEERVKKLLAHAARRDEAQAIRRYVSDARAAFKGLDESDVEGWSKWALDHADSLDPLLGSDARRFIEEFAEREDDEAEV